MDQDNSPQDNSSMQNENKDTSPQYHKNAKLMLVLVFVILLAIIGLLSFLLTRNETDDLPVGSSQETSVSEEANDEEQNPQQEVALSDGWLLVDTKYFTIKAPDGWEFTLQDDEVLISDCSDVECYMLEEGTAAVVTEVTGGRDGLQGLLVTLQAPGASIEEMTSGYTQLNKLDNNFTVYKKVNDSEPSSDEIGASLPTGSIEYILVRGEQDGSISYVYYSVLPTQTDPSDLVNEMVSTYTLKNEDLL